MNKEVIEFPYRTKRETLGENIPISEFRIHYYFYENYLEKDVYRCYSNRRENVNAIGYIFSVERLHSNNVVMSNVSNQSNFEAYMDAAREVFFNSEKHFIERYFKELNLNEESDKVRIDDILKYKAFLKLNEDKYTSATSFEDFKSQCEFPLVIFIEDVHDAEENQFNSEHMKVLMMLEHHYFPINDTNEFYASKKYLEFSNCKFISQNDEDEPIESELKTRIIKSISGDIDENSLKLMMEVLPEFYYQSFNTEYIKFSILYQYIEIFINLLAPKILKKTIYEWGDKSIIDLKSKINKLLTERERIKKLFGVYSLALQQIDKAAFYNVYNNILTKIDFLEGEIDTGEIDTGEIDTGEIDTGEIDTGEIDTGEIDEKHQKTHEYLYQLRNMLYHNLRAFKDKQVLDDALIELNIEFEKIIAIILTTFQFEEQQN